MGCAVGVTNTRRMAGNVRAALWKELASVQHKASPDDSWQLAQAILEAHQQTEIPRFYFKVELTVLCIKHL